MLSAGVSLVINFIWCAFLPVLALCFTSCKGQQNKNWGQYDLNCYANTHSPVFNIIMRKMSWPEYSCSHEMCLNSKHKIHIQILLSTAKVCIFQEAGTLTITDKWVLNPWRFSNTLLGYISKKPISIKQVLEHARIHLGVGKWVGRSWWFLLPIAGTWQRDNLH